MGVSLDFYHAWRNSGKSQRKFAAELGIPFNTLHSRIEYGKSQLRRAPDNMIAHTEIIETKTIYGYGEVVPVPDNEVISVADRGPGYYPGRPCIYDIETASLNAQSPTTILSCVCILTLDTNQLFTYTLAFEDHANDTRLLSEALAELRRFDILIGHFINGFDTGWIRTRALRAGLPPMPAWNTIDTLTVAKRTAKKAQRKSLGMLMDLLGIGWEKTGVFTNQWGGVFSDNKEEFDRTIALIGYHCQQDVLGTRGLLYKLWPSAMLLGGIPLTHNQ